MNEYSIFKADNSKEGSLTWPEGSLKVRNEFGNFPADGESIKHARAPYFLNVSKIREAIYISEGVFAIGAYREWRNTLYKSGYSESLVQKGNSSSLTR